MIFTETPIEGAYIIDVEPVDDARGYFCRVYCEREFGAHELQTRWVQCNTSYNSRAGTLRGLHYQREPHAEVKLVRCTRGALYDVAVDIRPGSSSFGRWFAVELSADNRRMFYIPEGLAHGYQSLVDGTELFYQVSAFYQPESEGGVRWDDAELNISWPVADAIVSQKDQKLPVFAEHV